MSQPVSAEVLVDRMLSGEAPERLRSAAARGALPLPRGTLARLYVHLLQDPVEEIRVSAQNSLEALEGNVVKELLADPTCAPEVLSHFAPAAARNNALAESIVFNAETPLEALGVLAVKGNTAVVELVLTNEERLRKNPRLLEQLMTNPALRANHRGRILELLDMAAKAQAESRDEATAADGQAEADALELEAAALLDVSVGDLLSESEIIDGDEFAHSEEPAIRGAYQKIITLGTAQKAIMAMKGGREERLILIRDTNKVVSLGVLKNPRINDGEIEAIAKMRNVSEEVLRSIAGKRDWIKSYQIMLALITNPRAPQTVTANFVPRLTDRDLKNVIKSREVPELIRRMARRTFDVRAQRAKTNFKKK